MSRPNASLLMESKTPGHSTPASIILTTSVLIVLAFSIYYVSERFVYAYAAVQLTLLAYFIVLGRKYPQVWTAGWPYILVGFNLIAFGSLIEISANLPIFRNSHMGDNALFRGFLKQIVGNNTGFLVLAFGFYRWVPSFLASRTVVEELVQKYETQLVRNEKLNALAGLVSGVAHELNNPLSIVIGFTGLLSRNTDPEFAQKALVEIERAARRCKKVADNLLVFARQPLPARHTVDIVAVLEEAVQLLDYQFRVEGIVVVKDMAHGVARTVVDPDQLLQVFFNLLNNARQSLTGFDGERRVTVRCVRRDTTIEVEVSDTGPGIAPENFQKIFQPFFTTKGPGEGTGLGLSICYGIIKAHGAEIRVSSERRVKTTFTCVFPIREGVMDESQSLPDPVPANLSGKSLLLIDDDEGILEFYRSYAVSANVTMDYCPSGEEAIKKIEAKHYDLILVDVRMPGKGGRELYRWMLEKRPEALKSLVFVTGDTADINTLEFLKKAERPYLLKPFTSASFDEFLGTHIEPTEGT